MPLTMGSKATTDIARMLGGADTESQKAADVQNARIMPKVEKNGQICLF